MTVKSRRIWLTICAAAVVIVLCLAVAFAFLGRGALPQNGADQGASIPPPSHVDGTVEGYYAQKAQWVPCLPSDVAGPDSERKPADMKSYECANIAAPLDWNNPSGEKISLRIAVHRTSNPKGALFFNPGGPGGSATTVLSSIVGDSFSKDLTETYDIVAMDPRGVGASTPVKCTTDQQKDRNRASEDAPEVGASGENKTPDQIVAEIKEHTQEIAAGCTKLSGNIAEHVDTVSAAKDFDVARQVLGQEKFNYLGYSYGTFLGATYANLFADKVGKMVLDGAIDPASSGDEVSALQLSGFEESIRHWIGDCQAGGKCPLGGDLKSGVQMVKEFLHDLEASPLPTHDRSRPLTRSLAQNAIVSAMYQTDLYPVLTEAMTRALKGNDGSILLRISDIMAGRQEDGTYKDNSDDAIQAINSLDYQPTGTVKDWEAEAQRMEKDFPILGDSWGYGSVALEAWPFPRTSQRQALKAAGSPPILVVGTTHDPATPYSMSQNLSQELENGLLLTYDGWGHTAYRKSGSQCILMAVDSFLIDGNAPKRGTVCSE